MKFYNIMLFFVPVLCFTSCELQLAQNESPKNTVEQPHKNQSEVQGTKNTMAELYSDEMLKYKLDYLKSIDKTPEVKEQIEIIIETFELMDKYDFNLAFFGPVIRPPLPCPGRIGELAIDPNCLDWGTSISDFTMGFYTDDPYKSSVELSIANENQPVAVGKLVEFDKMFKTAYYKFEVFDFDMLSKQLSLEVESQINISDKQSQAKNKTIVYNVLLPADTFKGKK